MRIWILLTALICLLPGSVIAGNLSFVINGKSFHQNNSYQSKHTVINYTCNSPAPQEIDPNNVPDQCREVGREVTTTDEQYNEKNTGFGFIYEFEQRNSLTPYVTIGTYKDSFDTDANYLSTGVSRKIMIDRRLDNLRLEYGGAVTLIHSPSYLEGRPLLTFMPVLTLATDTVGLNISYVPKINDTTTHVFFIQLKTALTH